MYAGSNTEVHPLIARHHALDTDAILASVRAVREHAAESVAEMDALRVRMAQYAQASEQMSAITSSLRAHGRGNGPPAQAVDTALDELAERCEGQNITRKMLNDMGYTEGSIPERLKAVEKALKASIITAQQVASSQPDPRFAMDNRTDLILDCLGVPRQDKSGTMLEDGRVMWLAGQAGYDMSEFPPHILEFSRQCNVGANTVPDLRAALVELLRKRTPRDTEPKSAPVVEKKIA